MTTEEAIEVLEQNMRVEIIACIKEKQNPDDNLYVQAVRKAIDIMLNEIDRPDYRKP